LKGKYGLHFKKASYIKGGWPMPEFNARKLHVCFEPAENIENPGFPRKYTLTHSDATGDLFLSIGPDYDYKKLSGFYSKLLRDEVLGEWQYSGQTTLDIHCHCSGGFILGNAKWRESIFRHHMPMVLKAICYGDKYFLEKTPVLQKAPVNVCFHASKKAMNQVENWGIVRNFMNFC